MFLLVFWSPKQVKSEESYEESWAKLKSHLPRVNPDCKEKKQRESAIKHILDDSRSSHFWSTFWSPNDSCYIPFQSLGSQQSNASNGVQFGVETKKLQPLQASHSKVLRNQTFAARILQHFCTVRCFSFRRCTNHAARGKLGTSRWQPTLQPGEDSLVLRKYFAASWVSAKFHRHHFSPSRWFLKPLDICYRHWEIFSIRFLLSKSQNTPCKPPITRFLSF